LKSSDISDFDYFAVSVKDQLNARTFSQKSKSQTESKAQRKSGGRALIIFPSNRASDNR
jgi:hypothetical protein